MENVTANQTEVTIVDDPSNGSFSSGNVFQVPDTYEAILYCAFFVLIITGNIWVIAAVIRQPKLRKSTTNWFIVSLSLSDLLVAIFQVPYHFFYEYFPGVFNALNDDIVVCRTFAWFQWTARFATVNSLIGVGVDRFRAIVQPMKPKISGAQAAWIIAIIWLASLGYSIYRPIMYTKQVYTFGNSTLAFCMVAFEYRPIYHWSRLMDFLVMYLVPLIVITSLYATMIATLWFSKGPSNASNRNKRRAVKMLSLVVIMFAFSWFPYYWFTLYYQYTDPFDIETHMVRHSMIFWHIAHTAYVSNSFINPFLYAYFSESFRREFYRMFPCLRRFATPRVAPDTTMNSKSRTNGTLVSTVSQSHVGADSTV